MEPLGQFVFVLLCSRVRGFLSSSLMSEVCGAELPLLTGESRRSESRRED